MKNQILVVEDNEINRSLLCEILKDKYTVLEASNGQEALEIVHQYADSISLILLDLHMPVMDGYTFLDIVKKDAVLSLIPVVVMTTHTSEEEEVAVLEYGAADFIIKPYRPTIILHRVANIITLRETAAMVNQFKYDRLTGLYSKEYFYKKIHECLDSDPDGHYFITVSDIENFKLYNAIFGVEAGNSLLKECATATKEIVGKKGIVCRYGADCFMCLYKLDNEKIEKQFSIMKSFSKFLNGVDDISFKWGTYEIVDRTIPVEQMCDMAILAVSSIKGKYGQSYAVYDDSFREKLMWEKSITDSMEIGLKEKQFSVYYQPKYNLENGRIIGAEALVRWIHPTYGLMLPGEFIPLFEKNGFITLLDHYVWEQVCAQLSEWKEKEIPLLPISVNVSRADVYRGDLADTLSGLVNKYGITPDLLHLEITESAYSDTMGPIIHTVESLRKLGFMVGMDDFGSGYSSLIMLSKIELDAFKLDMQFIQNETSKPEDHNFLKDVILMAHRNHLFVIAEGVETKDQADRLKTIGCRFVQGYYFAKPMPSTDYEQLLLSTYKNAGEID